MGKSKEAQIRTRKLDELRNLRACRVSLSDVALDSHLLELYPKLAVLRDKSKIVLKEKCKQEEQLLSCKSSSLFSIVYSLQSEGREERAILEDENYIMTRSRLRSRSTLGDVRKIGASGQTLEARTDTLSSLCNNRQGFIQPWQQLTSETSSEFFSSRNSDKTFIPSTSTCSSDQTQKTVVKRRTKTVFGDIKSRLRSSRGLIMASTTNKSFSDYSGEMRDSSMKSVVHGQCSNSKNNNLHSSDNVTDSMSTEHQEQPKKNKDNSSVPSNMTDSNVEYEVSINTTDQTIKTEVLPHLSEIHNNRNKSTKKVKRPVLKRSKPKIIANDILPKGALSINIVRLDRRTRDNDPLNSFSKQISLKQNGCNDSRRSIKETDNGDIDKSTNVVKEGKCHTSYDTNESVSDVKTADAALKFNINKDKDTLTHRLQEKKIMLSKVTLTRNESDRFMKLRNTVYNKTINNEETVINERLTINRTTQLGKLDVKEQISENNASQNSKVCNEPSIENVLSKDTSDLADIDERCDVTKPSVFVAEENAVNQNKEEHITESNIKTLNLKKKRRTLDIKDWLENQMCSKSKDDEQSTNFSKNTTIDLNINSKDVQSSDKEMDLREHLNKKRSKRAYTPTSSTSEIQSEESVVILEIMRNAFVCQFNNLFEKVYVTSLSKLSIEEILAIYQMIHDVQNSRNAARFKEQSRKLIIHSIVRELLKRQMPLKMIIDQLVVCIAPNKNVYEFQNILTSVESYVKRAEYWNTVRSLILMFEPSKDIIENVLRVCVETKNLADIEDVNNTLMNELDSILRLTLDRNLVKSFYNLITEKTARDSCPVATISRFGKCERVESIASPDSKQNAGALQAESSRTQDVASNIQMGSSSVLGKTLFDIGLNIVNSLMDEEAPRLALSLIQSLKIYGLPLNAGFFLLSAEIYLANDKTLEALDLLKHKNIICTSRAKWHVASTVNDERIRNKIVHILLDVLCVEFTQHAFFLFQFLLKDQSSQYHPIDLSRYIDKLIVLSLTSMDTSLITEAGNLVLKYNFALSATPCRALIATLIHTDEALASQIYNFAEGIGIYSSVKLTPVTYIILRTDLTEEEIYLAVLQLLKILKLNLGQGIEHAKPQHIKVYLYLEVKAKNENFSHTTLRYTAEQSYNSQAITNTKTLIRNVLKKRFDPSIKLMPKFCKDRVCRVQSTSLLNYLISEHI
ncbi:hypothetical protein DMN91_004677 [Ooceraea biroi]|uniref:Uncharacterized protein n=1 Tax=Ooceraea biroi TaxID=2015173 RepID=A0A3L8DR86_OOCBI|nr:hypothetical protein DMN91_004677 [Ooceraea biroi]